MARIKVGNVAGPGQPITGRAQGLSSPSARRARASLGQPTTGHGWALSSLRQLASLPPRHGTLSLKGFGPGVRDFPTSSTPTPQRERRAPECPSFRRPHRPAPHALAPLAAAAARPSLLRAGLLSVSSLTRDGDLNCATELHYPLIKSPEFQNIFPRKPVRNANSSPALQKHGVSGLFFHHFTCCVECTHKIQKVRKQRFSDELSKSVWDLLTSFNISMKPSAGESARAGNSRARGSG
jgi:hypothetical protein